MRNSLLLRRVQQRFTMREAGGDAAVSDASPRLRLRLRVEVAVAVGNALPLANVTAATITSGEA